MITPEMRSELSQLIIDLTEGIRGLTEPGASPERQIELVREAAALQLAGLMFAAEHVLKLGPQTEARRMVDRAQELFGEQAEMRRKLGIGR